MKSKPNSGDLIYRKFAIVIGMMLLIVFYYWGHNIGESSLALRGGIYTTARILVDIGLVMLLFTIGGGIGRRALDQVDFEQISTGERIVVDAAIGLGIISLITATMGLLGQFNLLIWVVLVVLALIVNRQVISWLHDMRDLIFRSGRPETPWERFVRAFLIVTIASALSLALAPPFAWDAINYHLVIPDHYVKVGSIFQNLENHFFGFPQNMEMLYGLTMMFGTDRAPAVLHLMLGVFSLIGIYNIVRRHASAKAAAVSVLVLMASFNIWQLMTWSYVDVSLMIYSTVGIIAIHQWTQVEDNRHHWLGIAAIAASIAAGIKYTAAPLIIALYLLVVLRDRNNIIRNTLIFGGLGVLLFTPWLIKGILLYDNPVFPYIFGGANWDHIRSLNFGADSNGFIGQGLWAHLPLLPIMATIRGVNKYAPYGFTPGVFLLTLPFVLLLGWKDLTDAAKQLARNLIPMAVAILLFWMFIAATSGIGGQTRLMVLGFPFAAILGGLAFNSIENWQRRPIDIVFITQAAFIITIFLGIFDYVYYFANSRVLDYQAGIIDEDTYLSYNMGVLYDAMLELEALPEDSRVLFLWEPKTYYCPDTLNCTGDQLFDNWSRPLQQGLTPEELLDQWESDYDYVLLFDLNLNGREDGYSLWSGLQEFAMEENALFPDYFYDNVQEFWSDDIAYTLYTWE